MYDLERFHARQVVDGTVCAIDDDQLSALTPRGANGPADTTRRMR
jgi:hypothetical protein